MEKEIRGSKTKGVNMSDAAKKNKAQKSKPGARAKLVEFAAAVTANDVEIMLQTMEIDVERATKTRL